MQSPINLNEATQRIKKAGATNVRVVPMPGQSINDGLYRIEILENGAWQTIVEGMSRATADGIVQRATNRTICG